MKILVCGGRDYDNEKRVNQILDEYYSGKLIIVHGAAPGADTLAGMWAMLRAVKQIPYPANWEKYGKSAGPIRNQQMLDENPDIKLVLAFPGGRGTGDMINKAKTKNIMVVEVDDVVIDPLDLMHWGEHG